MKRKIARIIYFFARALHRCGIIPEYELRTYQYGPFKHVIVRHGAFTKKTIAQFQGVNTPPECFLPRLARWIMAVKEAAK